MCYVGIAHPETLEVSEEYNFLQTFLLSVILYFSALLKALLTSACINHK